MAVSSRENQQYSINCGKLIVTPKLKKFGIRPERKKKERSRW